MKQLPLENQAELESSMRVLVGSQSHAMAYPPIVETITVTCSTHPSYTRHDGSAYPFTRLTNVPQKFHTHIEQSAIGSNRPIPGDIHDAYWPVDIERWLHAIGVHVKFIETKPT